MAQDTEIIGAVGHYIGAVMETAGLYAQNYVLETFASFFASIGALIYVAVLFVALITFALYGTMERVAYLMIGPGLFYWILTSTVTVQSVANQFGDRLLENNTEEQLDVLKGATDHDFSELPKVSYFFAVFDDLVSYVVQRTVGVFVDTVNHADVRSRARARWYTRLINTRVTDEKFLRFFSLAMLQDCGVAFQHGKSIAWMKTYSTGDLDTDEIARKEKSYQTLLKTHVYVEDDLRDYVDQTLNTKIESVMTCEEVWDRVVDLLKVLAEDDFEDIKPTDEEKMMFPKYDWDNVVADIQLRLADGSSDDTKKKAIEVLAAYYLYNSLTRTNFGSSNARRNSLTSQIASRSDWNMEDYTFGFGTGMRADIEGYQMAMTYFAASIPYIQGVLLYFLTMAFPFFALFLLVPGKYRSFFLWANLWMWVKSWDVGFAILHVVRDALWEFLPNVGKVRFGNIPEDVDLFDRINWDDPAGVLNVVYLHDPTNSMSTYYTVISILTMSVPVITATFFSGASQLYNGLSDAIDGKASTFIRKRSYDASQGATKDTQRYRSDAAESIGATGGAAYGYQNPGSYNGNTISYTGDNNWSANIGVMSGLGKASASMSGEIGVSDPRRTLFTGRKMPFRMMVNTEAPFITEAFADLTKQYSVPDNAFNIFDARGQQGGYPSANAGQGGPMSPGDDDIN